MSELALIMPDMAGSSKQFQLFYMYIFTDTRYFHIVYDVQCQSIVQFHDMFQSETV